MTSGDASISHDFKISMLTQDYEQITQNNQLKSLLLRLPSEVRNRVYYLALIQPCIEVHPHFMLPSHGSLQSLVPLSTCRQIRAEALLLYYSINTFDFQSVKDIKKFAETASPEICGVVKATRLFFRAMFPCENMVQEGLDPCIDVFPELEKVYVHQRSWTRDPSAKNFPVRVGKAGLECVFIADYVRNRYYY